MRFPRKNLNFHLQMAINWDCFSVRNGWRGPLSITFSSETPSSADLCRHCAYCLSLWEFICALIMFVQRVSAYCCPPFLLAVTLFLLPLLSRSLGPKMRDLLETYYLRFSAPRCLTLLKLSSCGSVFISISFRKKLFWWRLSKSLIYAYSSQSHFEQV